MSPIVRRKREKFVLPSKYVLLLLTVLCVGMMVITFMTDILGGPFNPVVGYTVVPFQRGISAIGSWMTERKEELSQIRILLEENQNLKQQIDELIIENNQLQQERYELNTLRELFKLNNQYPDLEKVGATIIACDSSNWFNSFTIDKGENDGIKIGQNVMAGSGLVGRIVAVGPNWAKVTSIIDDNSNVSGTVLATSDNLIVSGNLEMMSQGLICFSQLIDSADMVTVGDKIVTSSITTKYLPGILIGYIVDIKKDANKLTSSGTLTPAVDFEHLKHVLVILEMKQTIQD